MRASQAVCRINKLRVINTDRGIESLPLRHTIWVAEKPGCIAPRIARNRRNSATLPLKLRITHSKHTSRGEAVGPQPRRHRKPVLRAIRDVSGNRDRKPACSCEAPRRAGVGRIHSIGARGFAPTCEPLVLSVNRPSSFGLLSTVNLFQESPFLQFHCSRCCRHARRFRQART